MFPLGAAPGLAVNGGNSFVNIYGAGQGPRIQYEQPSLFLSTSNQATIQQFHPVAGPTSIQVRFISQLSQFVIVFCSHTILLP